jgi:DNA-binding HxlR family transcriptional regulator
VGDWWSLLIVRDALFGVERFGEFRQSLGLAKNILADRLKRLVADEILIRQGTGRRPLYRLSEKGRALAPTIVALMQWGDRWVSHNRPPVLLTDAKNRALARLLAHRKSGSSRAQAPNRTPVGFSRVSQAGPRADEGSDADM